MDNTLIDWLEKRIEITTQERNDSDDVQIKTSKGGKLKVYKEVLEYYKTHRDGDASDIEFMIDYDNKLPE